MTTWPSINRDNNFDLIRLFAALQVAFTHGAEHLYLAVPQAVDDLVRAFPGVPIFFFISGLLVTSSAVRRPLTKYAASRFRRIYPALLAAFVLALIILVAFGQVTLREITTPIFWIWTFTQVTVLQVFNPDMFRDFGVGTVNGSLWTIPVEIGFYIILPILFWIVRSDRRALSARLVVFGIVSFAIDWATKGIDESLFIKIVRVTPLAHFWLFALGALCYLHLERVMGTLSHLGRMRFGWAIPLVTYTAFAVLLAPWMPAWVADAIGFIILAAAILSAGLVAPSAAKLLGSNDISYGLYLYHMLVVNMLLELRITGATGVVVTLVISIALATLSWRYIESVVLHRKKRALTPADRFPA